MAGASVRVQGLAETIRAFDRLEASVAKEVRESLREAGEKTRETAESYAFGGITNIGNEWGEMRLGVTRSSVYIAPANRRSFGSPRPAFGRLLLTVAMLPAAERNRDATIAGIEAALDNLTREEGF